ncbi:MAG: tetratricopeptide repeat protein, partial [Anaerolineales bacterium]
MRLEAHLADLAYHYYESGAWAQAFEYSQRAGERASSLYAPYEAIGHFTRALEAARQLGRQPDPQLHGARGKAYETIGDFERADADLKTALELAREVRVRDRVARSAEWQALLDLGFLWASRDYSQTRDYFQQALDLAREMGDPVILAHSLNRLANWHANLEQPLEARRCHEEALAIFEALNHQRGRAETLDLLGMTMMLGGDSIQSAAYFERAIALFRDLDDRQGLISALTSLPMTGGGYRQADTTILAPMTLAETLDTGGTALKMAREVGWRAGEARALFVLASCLTPRGEYARALDSGRSALEIAQEIEHRQWITAAHCELGAIYLDMLALPQARGHLEAGLALARETSSLLWVGNTSGMLASTCILQRDFDAAEAVLKDAIGLDTPAQTCAQRLCWVAHAELALTRGDTQSALQITDRLIASTLNLSRERAIPRIWKLRGEALAGLHQTAEAEATLQAARETASARGASPLLWRIHVALGKLYQAQKRSDDAENAFSVARAIIEKVAGNVPGETLRGNFVQQANALIP